MSLFCVRYWIKVFRSQSSPTKPVARSAAYSQLKDLQMKTATIHKSVCHEDRKAGAVLARIHNIAKSELETLGLWNSDVLDLHYSQGVQTAKVVGRLSGFANSTDYYIPRARNNPFTHPEMREHQALFKSFMPQLDDQALEEKLLKDYAANTEKAAYNAFCALKLIRLIFWQDAPFLKKRYPDCSLFDQEIFRQNEEAFDKWTRIQMEEERNISKLIQLPAAIPEPLGLPPFRRERAQNSGIYLQKCHWSV